MQNNKGRVYFARFDVPVDKNNVIKAHPFVCIDVYTSDFELKTYMLCQSNDHDEKNKYRYTLKINNDDMTLPKFKNETVVNCNVRYVVNKELLNELDLKYAKLGFISKRDITAIDNLWKEAYQRDEHSFLHILNVECVQEKLIYDVVDDNGKKFKQKIDSSKQKKKIK